MVMAYFKELSYVFPSVIENITKNLRHLIQGFRAKVQTQYLMYMKQKFYLLYHYAVLRKVV